MREPAAILPTPILTQRAEVPNDPAARLELRSLSTGPGVFVLEGEHGGTLALATTANVRRAVAARLEPIDAHEPNRRIDYRQLARTIRAVPVGSAFEADWAYLQLARTRSPGACALAMDRWQSWFIHGDAQAQFPQWIKTAHPKREGGTHIGPFPDKHAAARYMDMLDDAFDLCRYHHILVQAPNATACAYKEMGKCPAPCDGSVSMDHYRAQVQAAIDFASTPIQRYRTELEQRLTSAELQQDESTMRACRTLLERTAEATKPSYSHVDRLDRFRFIAAMASERSAWARLIVILGGWIEPLMDVPTDIDSHHCSELHRQLMEYAQTPAITDSSASLENLSLVCWHLFRPAKSRKGDRGRFLRLDGVFTAKSLQQAIRALGKTPADESQSAVAEQFIEDARAAPA